VLINVNINLTGCRCVVVGAEGSFRREHWRRRERDHTEIHG